VALRASAAIVLLLWQLGSAAPSPSRHLRYQREIVLPPQASGQACLTLDAAVFAHTESTGASDVRIYGHDTERDFEVPFAMTESGPSTLDAAPATLGNVAARDGVLVFDLSMPQGDYTEVDLDLKAKNFVGAAQVTAVDARGRPQPLGTAALFDLSAQGLARSTVLPLPDVSYLTLHVQLRLVDLEGRPMPVDPSMVVGATVPPSREDQTAYTTVASASEIEQQGHSSAATMIVPAHVPIERAQFVLQPYFDGEFLRDATVAATPMEKGWEATGAAEGVSGHIFRVTRSALAGVPPITAQTLAINTVIGANLRSPAKVIASVDNGSAAPLPIARVDLQMRERKLCFLARPGTSYTLRYGNPELSAPSYSYARHFVPAPQPAVAALGSEQKNPMYVPAGADQEQQRPGRDLPWILLIAGVTVVGVTALQYVRHKREGVG
jgi:hypothetical protein